MEQKNLKTQVFIKEKIFNESAELPIDVDFTLPDYYPDITKILKCRAVPRISAKGVNGRNITIDGIVTVTVLYCNEKGKICSYEYQYPFQKIFECDFDTETVELVSKIRCEYINCRAVTSRKIDIHGACGVKVCLLKRRGTEIVSDIDDDSLELLRGIAPATSPVGYAEKYLLIDEEIELSSNQEKISSVVRYDALAFVKECKVLSSKAMVKGEVLLSALCSTDEGSLSTIRSNIPFSQILEIEGLNENCLIDSDAQVAFLEVALKTRDTGEAACLRVDAKLLVSCESSCDNDVAIVLDAYSRKYETSVSKQEVCFDKIFKNINESFTCKKNLEFQGTDISSIADMWCEVKVLNTKFKENCITVCGDAIVTLIARDSDMMPFMCEKNFDFEYTVNIDFPCENIKFTPTITVNSSSYTLTGHDSTEIRIELCVTGAVYCLNRLSVVTDITTDSTKPLEKRNRSAMTIYFASSGEKIWDIAYRYGASIGEIKQINDISADSIENDRMLLVPIN